MATFYRSYTVIMENSDLEIYGLSTSQWSHFLNTSFSGHTCCCLVKALLESEVTRAYSFWIEGCPVASAKATVEAGLSDSLRSHGVLMNQILSTTWESVEISEEGLEEGQKVTSTIRVPSTTSLGLSNALNELCCALLASGLHSASSAVQESACALSLEAVTRVYKDYLQKKDNRSGH